MPKRGADEGGEVDESKGGEGDLLAKAIKHCWGDGFLDVFRAYFRKHAEKFEVMAEGKTEEHALEYQELFNEYLQIFEGKLEEFIEREGSTITEFYTVIREHKSNPDPEVKLFINCLLASADYDSFFNVMKKEATKSLQRKRLLAPEGLGRDSKSTDVDGDGDGDGDSGRDGEDEEKEQERSSSVPPGGERKDSEERRHSIERSYK